MALDIGDGIPDLEERRSAVFRPKKRRKRRKRHSGPVYRKSDSAEGTRYAQSKKGREQIERSSRSAYNAFRAPRARALAPDYEAQTAPLSQEELLKIALGYALDEDLKRSPKHGLFPGTNVTLGRGAEEAFGPNIVAAMRGEEYDPLWLGVEAGTFFLPGPFRGAKAVARGSRTARQGGTAKEAVEEARRAYREPGPIANKIRRGKGRTFSEQALEVRIPAAGSYAGRIMERLSDSVVRPAASKGTFGLVKSGSAKTGDELQRSLKIQGRIDSHLGNALRKVGRRLKPAEQYALRLVGEGVLPDERIAHHLEMAGVATDPKEVIAHNVHADLIRSASRYVRQGRNGGLELSPTAPKRVHRANVLLQRVARKRESVYEDLGRLTDEEIINRINAPGRVIKGARWFSNEKIIQNQLEANPLRKQLHTFTDELLPEDEAGAVKELWDAAARSFAERHETDVDEFFNLFAGTSKKAPEDAEGRDILFQSQPFDEARARQMAQRILGENYTGRPPGVNSVDDVVEQMRNLQAVSLLGEYGRDWYERSARAILRVAHGDVEDAEKLAQLMAVFSPRRNVPLNTRAAIDAWNQFQATGKITGVGTTAQMKAAMGVLQGNPWEGRKTNSFYRNFLFEFAPERARAMFGGEPVTIDAWMFRLFGYPEVEGAAGAFRNSERAYSYSEDVTRATAELMGWKPSEVQAAAWSWIKDTWEAGKVGKKYVDKPTLQTLDEALGAPDTIPVMNVFTGIKRGREQAKRQAETSFAEALKKETAEVFYETAPGTEQGLDWWTKLPDYLQERMHDDLMKTLDEDGVNAFVRELGLLGGSQRKGLGVWEGKVTPGAAISVEAPVRGQAAKSQEVPQETRVLLDGVAAATGKVLRQDAVAWGRPVYLKQVSKHNAIHIKGKFSRQQAANLAGDIAIRSGGKVKPDDLAIIHADDGGFYVVNFGDTPNKDFHQSVDDLLGQHRELETFGWDGNLVESGTYDSAIEATGRSDVLQAALARVGAKAEQVFAQYRERATSRVALREPGDAGRELAEIGTPEQLLGADPVYARPDDVGWVSGTDTWTLHAREPGGSMVPARGIPALSKGTSEEVLDAMGAGFMQAGPDLAIHRGIEASVLLEDFETAMMLHQARMRGADVGFTELREEGARFTKQIDDVEHQVNEIDNEIQRLRSGDEDFASDADVDRYQELLRRRDELIDRRNNDMGRWLPPDTLYQHADGAKLDVDAIRARIAEIDEQIRKRRYLQTHSRRAGQGSIAALSDQKNSLRRLLGDRVREIDTSLQKLSRELDEFGDSTQARREIRTQIDELLDERKRIAPDALAQRGRKGTVKGAAQFLDDGRVILHALSETADISTFVHETGHVLRRYALSDFDENIAARWSGAKPRGKVGRFGIPADGWEWTREAEEKFAKGFEAYLREGRAPIGKLKRVFEKMAKLLMNIYKKAELPDLNPEMRKVFDRLLRYEKKRGGRMIGAEDFEGGVNYVPYVRGSPVPITHPFNAFGSYMRTAGALFGMARRRSVIGAGADDITLRKTFKAGLLRSGLFKADVTTASGKSLATAVRLASAHRAREALLEASTELPRTPYDVAIKEDPSKNLPEELKEMWDMLEGASRPDGERIGRRALEEIDFTLVDSLRAHVLPDTIEGAPAREVALQTLASQEPIDNIRWVSPDFIEATELRVASQSKRMAQSGWRKAATAGLFTVDAFNDINKAIILYLNPAYPVVNLVGNLMMNLFQQGPFALTNLPKAVALHWTMTLEERQLIDDLMGRGLVSSAPLRLAPKGVSNALAYGIGTVVDLVPRRAAFLHEARKRGLRKIDDLREVLANPEAHRELLEDITRKANDAIVDYERLGPFERDVLTRVIFFYPWLKGATRYSLRFPFEHPYQTALYTYLAMAQQGELPEDADPAGLNETLGAPELGERPYFTQFAIKLPPEVAERFGLEADEPVIINLRQAFTFTTPAELAQTGYAFVNEGPNQPDLAEVLTPFYHSLGVALFGFDPFTQREVDPGLSTMWEQTVKDMPPKRIFDALTMSEDERDRANENKIYPRELRHEVARTFLGGLTPTPYSPEIAQKRLEEERRKHMSTEERWQEDRQEIAITELGGEDRTLEETKRIYERYARANNMQVDPYLLQSLEVRETAKRRDLDAKFKYKEQNEVPLEGRKLDQVKALTRLDLVKKLYPDLEESWVESEQKAIATANEDTLEKMVYRYEHELGFNYIRKWNEFVNEWLESRIRQ